MSASEPLYQGKSNYQLSWETQITYSFVLNIKIHFVGAQHLRWLSIISIQVYLIDKNNNSHLGQVLLVSRIAWARRGKYNATLHNYLNRRWALHCQNVMTRYLHVPFTAMNDQERISPHNINTISSTEVMRIK